MKYQVRDADGSITEFEGELLGSGTSQRRHSPRWSELHIYKTEAGTYVVHKIGRTLVYHVPGAECGSKGALTTKHEIAPDREVVPCHQCRPDREKLDVVSLEQDRNTIHIATEAPGVIESCKTFSHDDSTLFLTRVARDALDAAMDKDPSLETAFYHRKLA